MLPHPAARQVASDHAAPTKPPESDARHDFACSASIRLLFPGRNLQYVDVLLERLELGSQRNDFPPSYTEHMSPGATLLVLPYMAMMMRISCVLLEDMCFECIFELSLRLQSEQDRTQVRTESKMIDQNHMLGHSALTVRVRSFSFSQDFVLIPISRSRVWVLRRHTVGSAAARSGRNRPQLVAS